MEELLIVPALLTVNSLVSHNIFNIFARYRELVSEKKYELINRITGGLFLLYICYTGIYTSSDEDVKSFIRQVAGYMLYETGHLILYSHALPMYIHHCVYIFCYLIMNTSTEENRYIFFKITWFLESTAPLLSVCWCLHLFKYPDTYLHKFIKAIAFLYWSLIRVVYFPYYIIRTRDIVVYTLGFPIILLNLYWFRLLVKRISS